MNNPTQLDLFLAVILGWVVARILDAIHGPSWACRGTWERVDKCN